MPQHPAAPEELDGLLEAFEQAVQAVIDLGWACRAEEFSLETELAGWTVKDQVSYVIAIESTLAKVLRESPIAAEQPPWSGEAPSRFKHLVAVDVDTRRQWEGRSIVTDLADFHRERMTLIRQAELDLDADVSATFGPGRTVLRQLRACICDVWAHEQDLRVALDRPGDLDTPAAAMYTWVVLDALPRLAARTAGIAPGHVILLDVTGPVMARGGVRVIYGEDGRPYGEALFTGQYRPEAPAEEQAEGEEQPGVTTVHLTTDALTRRAAGRRTTDEIHYTVNGDEEAARHLLDALDALDVSA